MLLFATILFPWLAWHKRTGNGEATTLLMSHTFKKGTFSCWNFHYTATDVGKLLLLPKVMC